MHESHIKVLSMRKDGTSFNADLPGEGKQWVSIPEGLRGRLEYQKSYDIKWTRGSKKQDGSGYFYDLKGIGKGNGAVGDTPIRPHISSPVQQTDMNKQIAVLAMFKTVWPTFVALEDAGIDDMALAKVMRVCMKAYDMSLGGQNIQSVLPPYDDRVDDIGDTF